MLNITSTGVEVSGDLTIAEKIIHKDDPNTHLRFGTNADTFAITTSGTERLHIGPAGNVGLGTNPSANGSKNTLHIHEGTHGAAIRLSQGSSSLIRYDDTNGLQVGTIADKNLSFETNDITAMTIDTGQNVGIGTSSPDTQLHIKSTGAVALKLEADTDNVTETDNPLIELIQDSGLMQANIGLNGDAGTAFTDALENAFYIEHNRSIQFANDNQAHLTIATSGKVGIGTHYPSSLLTLSGSGGYTSGLTFQNSTENVHQYFDDDSADSDFFITYEGNGGAEITLQHDGKLALNASNGDNVGIGTTSPIADLQIGDGASTQTLLLLGPNFNTTSSQILFGDNADSADPFEAGMGIRYDSTGNFLHIDDNYNDGGSANNAIVSIDRDEQRVGINKTDPQEALHVDGNIKANGTITSTSTVSRPIQNNEDDDATNTDSKPIRNIRNMKQSAYDDLVTAGNVDDHTLYIIVG